ncbi:MAG: hypothetical protein CSA24_01775 [Deltaproteobacteria bacterium]|nr:MAG: hypothetical protein CSA24_01775 [Deltaproteobacteria bacterium]
MKRTVTVVSLFAMGLALFACAGSSMGPQNADGGSTDRYVPQPDAPGASPDVLLAKRYRLTIVGWQQIALQQSQQVVLQVRLTQNEESAANEPVTFAFKGSAGDAALSTFTAITDSQGFAETTLTAGSILGSFDVEANHSRAQAPVLWAITVEKKPDVPPATAKLAGTFTLSNTFNITGQFSGSALADVLNLLEDFSDDPDDPGKFIVDLILDEIQSQVDSGIFNQISNLFRSLLYTETNKLLQNLTLVQNIKQIAKDLSDLARRFTIVSRMVSAAPQPGNAPMTVTHTLDRIKWTIGGQTMAYTFAQLGMADPTVSNLELTLSNGSNLAIAKHRFDLKFGAFLLVGLNSLIIPKVNSSAKSINDLLKGWVDCVSLGKTMDNATNNLIGPTIWQQGCESGLTMAGSYIEKQVLKLGTDQSKLEVQGQCKLTDQDSDTYYDTMTKGVWTGTFSLNGNPNVIAGSGNEFAGGRTQ